MYDIFAMEFRNKEDKPKSDIYTGEGSNIDIRLGRCEDLIKEIKNESIDAIITDPPFQVLDKDWDKELPTADFWNECHRVLLPGSHLVFFGQVSKTPEIMFRMSQTEFQFRDIIIWNHAPFFPKGYKTEDESFRSKVRTGYTPIFVYRKKLIGDEKSNWEKHRNNLLSIDDTRMSYKGNHLSIIKKFEETGERHHQSTDSSTYGEVRGNGWVPNSLGCVASNSVYCARPTRAERTINGQIKNEHPTVKSISLMVFLTRLFTNNPEQRILDPWVGSGSGAAAARYCTRKFVGFEMNQAFVELAKFRAKHVFDLDEKIFQRLRLV
jgi:DNA modification methylase